MLGDRRAYTVLAGNLPMPSRTAYKWTDFSAAVSELLKSASPPHPPSW